MKRLLSERPQVVLTNVDLLADSSVQVMMPDTTSVQVMLPGTTSI